MDERLYVEQLIAGSFVKYTKLSQLIGYSYAGSTCTNLNIFIDLNSVLKPMYSVDRWSYKSSSGYEIAATVINMCAHYREFFRAIGVSTNIYIIYGLNCPEANNTYVSGYNTKFINSYIKKPDTTALIEKNLAILNLLCQYLPNIYFFDIGNCEVASMIDHLIVTTQAREKGFENLVISKDVLALELIPEDDVRIIRPIKTKNGDESVVVFNRNLWNAFAVYYRKVKNPETLVSNNFFQNVLAMTAVPERSVYSVISFPKAIHIMDTASKNGFLDPNKMYTQSTVNTVLAAMDIPCNPAELEMRFRAISVRFQSMYVLPMEHPEFKRLRLVNLDDPNSVKEIVSKYFTNIPIDLDRL